MKTLTVGKRVIPIWLVAVLLVSVAGSTVLGYIAWTTLTIPVEVQEPIEILSYPSKLNLYPGDIKEFTVTVENQDSKDHFVILEFALDNSAYQDSYVTFSNDVYTIRPGEYDIIAWFKVKHNAPSINATLSVGFKRVESPSEEALFFEDFDDGVANGWTEHLGTWKIIDGKYFVTVGMVENGISTVDNLDLTDYVIETKLKFTDSVGFRSGIVFRYLDNEHYYAFELSNEYDCLVIVRYAPEDMGYTVNSLVAYTEDGTYPIQQNIDYVLKVKVQGTAFRCFVNGEEVLSGTDNSYTTGKVGLRARRADVYFDYFSVTALP